MSKLGVRSKGGFGSTRASWDDIKLPLSIFLTFFSMIVLGSIVGTLIDFGFPKPIANRIFFMGIAFLCAGPFWFSLLIGRLTPAPSSGKQKEE